MSDKMPELHRSVSVAEFASAREHEIEIDVIGGRDGLGNLISSPRVQKLGLSLAGFSGYMHTSRLQIFGGSEYNYLKTMDPSDGRLAIERLSGRGICCILVTKGLEIPEDLLGLSARENIPLLRTSSLSSLAISKATAYLEARLAPQMTIHGVMMDIFGVGILLLGPSGIGKSECALELVLKGHRLVADDAVVISRRSTNRLMGSGGKVLNHHMELRGLGIIDVKELFGISATGISKSIDLALKFEVWDADEDYERIGLDRKSMALLGVTIPLIKMPVAPGRNLAVLVEVAARTHLQRLRGYSLSEELAGLWLPEKRNQS